MIPKLSVVSQDTERIFDGLKTRAGWIFGEHGTSLTLGKFTRLAVYKFERQNRGRIFRRYGQITGEV